MGALGNLAGLGKNAGMYGFSMNRVELPNEVNNDYLSKRFRWDNLVIDRGPVLHSYEELCITDWYNDMNWLIEDITRGYDVCGIPIYEDKWLELDDGTIVHEGDAVYAQGVSKDVVCLITSIVPNRKVIVVGDGLEVPMRQMKKGILCQSCTLNYNKEENDKLKKLRMKAIRKYGYDKINMLEGDLLRTSDREKINAGPWWSLLLDK